MKCAHPDRRTTTKVTELLVGFAPTLFLLVLALSCLGWIALTLQGHHDWFMRKAYPDEGWEIPEP
jgi:hypothetical protein